MSYYYSVRGWLECYNSAKILRLINDYYFHIEDKSALLHIKEWCSVDAPLNMISYVFYGGYVNSKEIQYFEDILELLSQVVEDEEEDAEFEVGISGYFHIQGEDGASSYVYIMHNHSVAREDSPPLFQE